MKETTNKESFIVHGLLALAEIKRGVLNNKNKWKIAADKINQDEVERLRKHAEELKIMAIYNNCPVIPPKFTRYVGGMK